MRSFELTLMVVIPAALLLCAGAAGTAVLAYRCFRRRLARRPTPSKERLEDRGDQIVLGREFAAEMRPQAAASA
jgi:hypothetical protein